MNAIEDLWPLPATAQRCACGNPIDHETAALVGMFPKLIPAGKCDACIDYLAAKDQQAKQAEEVREEEARRQSRLEVVPPEMRRTRINYPGFNAGLWTRIERWEPSGIRWLGLLGPAGECKTRCMALLAMRLIKEGHHVMWAPAVEYQDAVDDLRSGSHATVSEARGYLSRCKRSKLLVLDDFGKNTWNASIERHLFDLIDYRKTHDLPVIWSANTHPVEILTKGQLSHDRGAPLIGRLLEASKIEKV